MMYCYVGERVQVEITAKVCYLENQSSIVCNHPEWSALSLYAPASHWSLCRGSDLTQLAASKEHEQCVLAFFTSVHVLQVH
jgi:hypothetical protein